jgi:hypothetical protein
VTRNPRLQLVYNLRRSVDQRARWSAPEWREGDREDSASAAALEQELALMPAYEVLLYEPLWAASDHEDAPTLS